MLAGAGIRRGMHVSQKKVPAKSTRDNQGDTVRYAKSPGRHGGDSGD